MTRPRAFLLACAALLAGCASEAVDTTGAPIEERAAPEPATGLPQAPPLGSPRPKLAPGEVVPDERR